MQKVLVVSSMNYTPEDEIAERLSELGPEWRVISASTSLALQGSVNTDGFSPQGINFGLAQHVYFVTTLIVEKPD